LVGGSLILYRIATAHTTHYTAPQQVACGRRGVAIRGHSWCRIELMEAMEPSRSLLFQNGAALGVFPAEEDAGGRRRSVVVLEPSGHCFMHMRQVCERHIFSRRSGSKTWRVSAVIGPADGKHIMRPFPSLGLSPPLEAN